MNVCKTLAMRVLYWCISLFVIRGQFRMETGRSLFLNSWYTFIVYSVKKSDSFRIIYNLNNGSVCALYLLFTTILIALLCNLDIRLL